MKKGYIVLIGILAMFFASCTHLNKAFPEELNDYLPYISGQKIQFINGLGDTLDYAIKIVESSVEEKVPWNCKCRLTGAKKYIYFDNNMGFCRIRAEKKYLEASISLSDSNNLSGEHGLSIECSPFVEGVSEEIGDSIFIEDYDFNAIIVKGKGITEFTIGGTKWTLIDQQKQ